MKDNVVLITGASKGIGAELARQLAAKGAKLALAARSGPELRTVAEQCRALGAAAITVATDVAIEEDEHDKYKNKHALMRFAIKHIRAC